jgi:hypothetical protein
MDGSGMIIVKDCGSKSKKEKVKRKKEKGNTR